MALARMMTVHYRPWHHRTGRALEDHGMAIRDLGRRLDRLDRDGANHLTFGEALEAAQARTSAWYAAGNKGRPPRPQLTYVKSPFPGTLRMLTIDTQGENVKSI